MHHAQELVTAIDRRLNEARQEIAALQAARAAMDGGQGVTRAATDGGRRATRQAGNGGPATSPAARGRARRRARPAAAIVPAGKLEALLAASPGGVSTGQLAEQTRGDRAQILTLLREMEAEGRIRRSGTARAVRWHVVTDEERIAARVAELEAQMKRGAPAG